MPSTVTTEVPAPGLLSRLMGKRGLGLLRGFLTVAGLTVLGKVVSFLKDALVASYLGTADAMDAYALAFGLLTFVASVIGGGIPSSFMPVYAEVRHRRSMRRAQRLALQSTLGYTLLLALAGVVIWVAAPRCIELIGSGFSADKQLLATRLIRGLVPFMIGFGLTIQLGAWLRAERKFALAAGTPMMVPVLIIVTLLWVGHHSDVWTLTLATILGVGLQCLLLTYGVWREASGSGLRVARLWLREPRTSRVLSDALPYMLAGVIHSSVTVVDQSMAAQLHSGSVAVLSYADKICGMILALTAVPATEVLFPHFAEMVAKGEWAGLRQHLRRSCMVVVAVALPMVAAIYLLAPWVVSVMFERGAFGPADTERVAHILRYAIFQVPFFILGGLLSRVLVTLQSARLVLIVSAVAMVFNAGLNALLMRWLGLAGIALSTVFVTFLLAMLVGSLVIWQIRVRERGEQEAPRPS
ncbi:MAG: polysaccharide biosynthesis C-terminal domain-containing protein [Verrucomicrobiales bacterium]|nr:polysaccharide biosynthesis C-terminal domain-containing protein [Verrucomicrobiales bacterium]MCP5559053.1 polysaccharide biosynthesis C-terminal domain-containing protein [Verrucomicrobiaceae bacterium]